MTNTSEPLTPASGESLQERLRAARAQKQEKEPIRIPIPGCDVAWETDDGKKHEGHLVARYLPLRYRGKGQMRDISNRQGSGDPATDEIMMAAGTIVAACDGIEAVSDGQSSDLGVKMGRTLADYLGLDTTDLKEDTEAVFLIIPDEIQLINHSNRLTTEMGIVDEKLVKELLGNSGAAS
jgi:hypothetical protein